MTIKTDKAITVKNLAIDCSMTVIVNSVRVITAIRLFYMQKSETLSNLFNDCN